MSKKYKRHRFDFEDWEEVEEVIKTKLPDIKKYGKILMFDFLKGVYDAGCDEGEIIGYKSALQENNLNTEDEDEIKYDEGFDDGQEAGRQQGYDEGFDDGVESGVESGYKTGREDGEESGKESGYESGWEDGIESTKYQ